MKGSHPITGDIFSEDHVCNDPQVIRALHKEISVLRSKEVQASL